MSPRQRSDSSQGPAAVRRQTYDHTLTPAATHTHIQTRMQTHSGGNKTCWREERSEFLERGRVITAVSDTKEVNCLQSDSVI